MKATIRREITIVPTARAKQVAGLFDLPVRATSALTWDVNLDLPRDWQIGVIAGASGDGKSTVARELFGDALVSDWPWPADKSVVDGFPAGMSIKEITGLLSSVGFSSPPAWLRPFRVLSNGQQFRAHLARTLAERADLAVVDEFTSVVDRQQAKIGSAAIAKTVRARGGRFIAVTCHYDVLDWLEPDWVYEPATDKLTLNSPAGPDGPRGSLWRRPAIDLEIVRTTTAAWPLFRHHHYLSGELHRSAACYVGLIGGEPAAFTAVLPFPHATRPGWREHRTVCRESHQGAGIGNAMSEAVASLYVATGRPYFSTTSHPAMVRHRARSPLWRMSRAPSLNRAHNNAGSVRMASAGATSRLSAGFEYVGPARPAEAKALGVVR